jgi:hypothetical protein
LRAAIVPIAFNECFDLVLLVPDHILSLIQPWLAFALRFSSNDELQAFRYSVQRLIEGLAVMDLVISSGVIQMGIEDSCVVACLLHELGAVEVPHEVVGLVDVLLRQVIKGLGNIPVLLIEKWYLHSHPGG